MKPIKITQNENVLAEHSVDSPLSHYGQPVWTIQEPEPALGAAIWQQGAVKQSLEIITVFEGWLVCRQADGLLCGIIWSEGCYYANIIEEDSGTPASEWGDTGLHVRGTIPICGGLGVIIPLTGEVYYGNELY